MAKIHIKRQHNLSREEVRTRVDAMVEDLETRLEAECAWKGDSLRFERKGASGSIDVGDGFVEINIELGMLLSPMKKKIEQTILRDIESALA